MRKMYILTMLFTGALLFGQVGSNNVAPKTTVDMTSKTTDRIASEVLLIPLVTQ